MRKYNKGEWSEIYAFVYLLNSGVLYAADKDLNKYEDIFYPIQRIIREEKTGEPIDYVIGSSIKIFKGTNLLKEVQYEEVQDIVAELLDKIPHGKRAFEIPSVDDFFDSIYCNKVKEKSSLKQDMTLQLHDINTGLNPVCGFSIKSYLGADPTLINAGKNTNFTYVIKGCTETLMKQVNEINTTNKLVDKMKALLEAGCSFELLENSISPQFIENLQFIDSCMPKLVNYMLLYRYVYGKANTKDIVEKMQELNPLEFSNTQMYTVKCKKWLCAAALGLTPEKINWMGNEDANGGYITVKKNGSILCYHLHNRKEFEQYLFDYTYFDKPSTSKHQYFTITQDKDGFKIQLCLQVRFH